MERIQENRQLHSHERLAESNWTSYEDGHRHELVPLRCRACAKIRRVLMDLNKGFTEVAHDSNGVPHRHWIKGDIID